MADGGKILSLGRMSGSNLGKMSINFGSQKSLPLRNSNYAKSRLYWPVASAPQKFANRKICKNRAAKFLPQRSDKKVRAARQTYVRSKILTQTIHPR